MAAAVAAVLLYAHSAAAQQNQVMLPLTVNGVSAPDVRVAILDGDVAMRADDLEALGLVGPIWDRLQRIASIAGSVQVGGAPALSLRELNPWVQYVFDESNLTLSLQVDPRLLPKTTLEAGNTRPQNIEYRSDTSAFVNYALTSNEGKEPSLAGEIGWNVGKSLFYSGFSRTTEGEFVRGLTNVTIDNRKSLRRWIVGDAPVSTDALGGSALLGGVTVAKNFSLDPYFFRYPTLAMSGMALTPSRVEVYVNGVLVAQKDVPPGPFNLADIPGTSGAGVTRLVIRDAFGNEVASQNPFYFSTSVLARGLSEYVYSAGSERQSSTSAFDYGKATLIGYHRYGVTDFLTLGGRFEANQDVWSGGPNLALRSRLGDFGLTAAASGAAGRTGVAGEFDYSYVTRRLGISASLRSLSQDYETVSTIGSPSGSRLRRQTFATVSVPLPYTSVALQWMEGTYNERDLNSRRLALIANASISSRVTAIASAARVNVNRTTDSEFMLGISFAFGSSSTASVTATRIANVDQSEVSIQKPLATGIGYGYRVRSIQDPTSGNNGEASLQYQSSFGRYELVGRRTSDQSSVAVSAAGGLVLQGGDFLFTRPVDQSFALVRVPGVAGVEVYASNLSIGRTNSRGDLLVPTLSPYYGNPIRIQDKDIPMSYEVLKTERIIAPPYRGGALVEFPVRKVRTITGAIRLMKKGAANIPSYGEMTIAQGDEKASSPLGSNGEFYFENLNDGSFTFRVISDYGSCTGSGLIPSTNDTVVRLGTITCNAQ